jgi:hypothetical protein
VSEERSASGAPIFRHEQAERLSWSGGDPALVEAVNQHVERYVGTPAQVWHEAVSPYVHVAVHVVEPSDDRPAYTLVTSGMSERPMAGPEGDRYAELVMVLPPTWPGPDQPHFDAPEAHWPYKLLQDLARLPHEFATRLWSGHTVPNGDPPEPYASNTSLCGALLAPPLIHPDGFARLAVGEREVCFFAVIPLHQDEMELKLDSGLDALYDLLDAARITEILNADRPSVIPRKRKLFRR